MAVNKKLLTLKEASVISGYTVSELRSFLKIGLIPSVKRKGKVFVRFSAFEKLSAKKDAGSTRSAKKSTAPKVISMNKLNITSLVPFTKPNRAMVKVLEPVSFAAAIVMILYVLSMPGAAMNIVGGIALANDTVAFMGQSTMNLVTTAVSLPVITERSVVAVIPEIAPDRMMINGEVGRVAGIATVNNVSQIPDNASSMNIAQRSDQVFISIADASETFERTVNQISDQSFDLLVSSLSFQKLDPIIQQTFKW